MDNNNRDNSFELYPRRQSSRDVPASNDTNNTAAQPPPPQQQRSIDEFNPTSISIISGARTTDSRPPSVKLKPNRKRSSAGSDVTDKNDANNKGNRTKGRNSLTSSFLRRKRIEYAGTNLFSFFLFQILNQKNAYTFLSLYHLSSTWSYLILSHRQFCNFLSLV